MRRACVNMPHLEYLFLSRIVNHEGVQVYKAPIILNLFQLNQGFLYFKSLRVTYRLTIIILESSFNIYQLKPASGLIWVSS